MSTKLAQRPFRIGVSSCFFHADPQRAIFKGKTLLYTEQSLVHWAQFPGNVLAYIVPNISPDQTLKLAHYVHDLDGLILSGGSDLAPESYGEGALKPEWAGDAIRDRYELALLNEFIAQQKPVLGICRGMQLINVAFGGTLYQDIETQVKDTVKHRDWNVYDGLHHRVVLERGGVLDRLYPGVRSAVVNSVHHQGVKDLGRNMAIEARSEADGIIEAIRWKGESFVMGLQWHPEFHPPGDLHMMNGQPVLEEFLKEARRKRGG